MATIKGKWKFNEVIDFSTLSSPYNNNINLSFESGGQKLNRIQIGTNWSYTYIGYYLYTEDGPPDFEQFVYISEEGWYIEELYRTVDFGETEQTIEDEYYNWILANASEQTPTEKIYSVKSSTMTAIASAIREVTSEIIINENDYTPVQMPQAILDAGSIKYDKGYSDGIEQGKQAEYDRFWDAYQKNGTETNYYQKFTQGGWNDTTFNPKYPIICKGGSTNATAVFARIAATRIPVPVTIEGIAADSTFFYAGVETIILLVLNGVTGFSSCFTGCSKLKNITIEGSIDASFNISATAVLTVASAKNIILHMTNFSGTDKAYANTLKFNDAVWAALEADEEKAPGGIGWKEYVQVVLCCNV